MKFPNTSSSNFVQDTIARFTFKVANLNSELLRSSRERERQHVHFSTLLIVIYFKDEILRQSGPVVDSTGGFRPVNMTPNVILSMPNQCSGISWDLEACQQGAKCHFVSKMGTPVGTQKSSLGTQGNQLSLKGCVLEGSFSGPLF